MNPNLGSRTRNAHNNLFGEINKINRARTYDKKLYYSLLLKSYAKIFHSPLEMETDFFDCLLEMIQIIQNDGNASIMENFLQIAPTCFSTRTESELENFCGEKIRNKLSADRSTPTDLFEKQINNLEKYNENPMCMKKIEDCFEGDALLFLFYRAGERLRKKLGAVRN